MLRFTIYPTFMLTTKASLEMGKNMISLHVTYIAFEE